MLVQSVRSRVMGPLGSLSTSSGPTDAPKFRQRVIARPLSQPLPGGGERWLTPSGGVASSLARRVW